MGDQWIGDATEYLCVGTFFRSVVRETQVGDIIELRGSGAGRKNRQLLVRPACVCVGGLLHGLAEGLYFPHIYFPKITPISSQKNMARLLQPFIWGKTTCASNFRERVGLFLSPDRKLSHDDFSRFLDMAVKMRPFVNQRVLSKKLENA